ncbi:thymidylate synthase, partial [Bacillus pumilus]|nr:thymidylate synthase [Bacillus pumilus]
NHLDQVQKQLTRSPYQAPKLNIKRKPESIFEYNLEDFDVVDYEHHPLIKGDVAV